MFLYNLTSAPPSLQDLARVQTSSLELFPSDRFFLPHPPSHYSFSLVVEEAAHIHFVVSGPLFPSGRNFFRPDRAMGYPQIVPPPSPFPR